MVTRRRFGIAVVVLLVAAVAATTALATLPSGQTVTLLVRAHAWHLNARADGIIVGRAPGVGNADVAMLTVTYDPGGSSGWHHHPGVGLVAVQTGSITRYTASCAHHTYHAGQVFVEKGSHPNLVRNNTAKATVLQATFIVPATATDLRIDDPQPATCSVH
jgi:quercetin dioxygenase-like cupin family protein